MNELPRPKFSHRRAMIFDAVKRMLAGERHMVIAWTSWITPDLRKEISAWFGDRIAMNNAAGKTIITPAGGINVKAEVKP